MFNTHPNNIHGIKAAVSAYGDIWFHGDGNIYHKKEDSDFRKEFSNDRDGAQTYRINFKKGDSIPSTTEELNKLLLQSKTKEVAEAARPKEVAGISTFKVEIPIEEADGPADGIPASTKKGSKKKEADGPADGAQ